jgi:hypothetical protein
MTISCPITDNATGNICAIMNSAGAGLGVFVQYMATALPPLLIVLAIIGVIVAIGGGIGYLLRGKIANIK